MNRMTANVVEIVIIVSVFPYGMVDIVSLLFLISTSRNGAEL